MLLYDYRYFRGIFALLLICLFGQVIPAQAQGDISCVRYQPNNRADYVIETRNADVFGVIFPFPGSISVQGETSVSVYNETVYYTNHRTGNYELTDASQFSGRLNPAPLTEVLIGTCANASDENLQGITIVPVNAGDFVVFYKPERADYNFNNILSSTFFRREPSDEVGLFFQLIQMIGTSLDIRLYQDEMLSTTEFLAFSNKQIQISNLRRISLPEQIIERTRMSHPTYPYNEYIYTLASPQNVTDVMSDMVKFYPGFGRKFDYNPEDYLRVNFQNTSRPDTRNFNINCPITPLDGISTFITLFDGNMSTLNPGESATIVSVGPGEQAVGQIVVQVPNGYLFVTGGRTGNGAVVPSWLVHQVDEGCSG